MDNPLIMARLENPLVDFKHCTKEDQNDALDDRTCKTDCTKRPELFESMVDLSHLETSFPLKNKTKS